ncbi:hypothetical protein GQ53DRAFT_829508 [Thozetella sp. PMI_491]|nr:hypothetical protein GQ53DRAFT_829508 [Thozetella sp. PMI_491]
MQPLLCIGASAAAIEGPKDPGHIAASHRYLARSLASQISAVTAGVNRENREVLYSNEVLIATATVVQHCLIPLDKEHLGSIADWFRCWWGVKTIATLSFKVLPGDAGALAYSFGIYARTATTPERPRPSACTFAFLLTGLPRMSTPHKAYKSYQRVAAFLDMSHSRRSRVLHGHFLVTAPSAFVRCVERCEPTALLLMGVYFGMTRIMDTPNVFDLSAEADLRVILLYLPGIHKKLLKQALDIIGTRGEGSYLSKPCQDVMTSLAPV